MAAPGGPLSYSSVRTYLECPLRWKFLYVDELPEEPRGYFSFGRTVHAVLEAFVRPLLVPGARRMPSGGAQRTLDDWAPVDESGSAPSAFPSRDDLFAHLERLWISEGYQTPEEEARYRAIGRDILGRFHSEFLSNPPRPVAVEEHLVADWDGIPIHGYLDRIDRTPSGGLEIVDYKTSRELSVLDARQSDQLALYQVLVERNFVEPVEHLTLYHLRSVTPLRVPARSPKALEGLFDRVVGVQEGLQAAAFEPTPGRHCLRCEFKQFCPEFREAPVDEQARLAELVDRYLVLRSAEDELGMELAATTAELHRLAERFGIYRLHGSSAIAVRRREESWNYPVDQVVSLLEREGRSLASPVTADSVRRLALDPELRPALRRQLRALGSRELRWSWDVVPGRRAS